MSNTPITVAIDPLNAVYLAFFGVLMWRSGFGAMLWRASFGTKEQRQYYRQFIAPDPQPAEPLEEVE